MVLKFALLLKRTEKLNWVVDFLQGEPNQFYSQLKKGFVIGHISQWR